MRVRFVRARTFQTASSTGPSSRVFEIGDVVDLPEMHALMVVAAGDALDANTPAPTPPAAEPVTPRKRSSKHNTQ